MRKHSPSLLAALVAAGALFHASTARALPIHCIASQVVGTWTLEMTAPGSDGSCGYAAPATNQANFTTYKYDFVASSKKVVTLAFPNRVQDDTGKAVGTWTMVSDQGVEINLGGQSFFAYLSYSPKPGTSLTSGRPEEYVSSCGRTRIGPVRLGGGQFACWRGTQTAALPSAPAGDEATPVTLSSREVIAALPKSFNWRERLSLPPVRNQGSCGFDWAIAVTDALAIRAAIPPRSGPVVARSPQSLLSCGRLTAACEGGDPYLALRTAREVGVPLEASLPYTASTATKCPAATATPSGPSVSAYGYVGGYYGASSESAIMREIFNSGPVVVGFYAPESLFYYKGGVFTGPSPKSERQSSPTVASWTSVNRYMTIVGWDETSDNSGHSVKVWIVRSTWGSDWGENGYLRIRRGTNECGIEGMALSFQLTP